MVALRQNTRFFDTLAPEKIAEAERRFIETIENPKPATEYLKKMFRIYGNIRRSED